MLKTIRPSSKEEIDHKNVKKQNTIQRYIKEDDSLYTSLNSISESGGISLKKNKSNVSMRRKRFGIPGHGVKMRPSNKNLR